MLDHIRLANCPNRIAPLTRTLLCLQAPLCRWGWARQNRTAAGNSDQDVSGGGNHQVIITGRSASPVDTLLSAHRAWGTGSDYSDPSKHPSNCIDACNAVEVHPCSTSCCHRPTTFPPTPGLATPSISSPPPSGVLPTPAPAPTSQPTVLPPSISQYTQVSSTKASLVELLKLFEEHTVQEKSLGRMLIEALDFVTGTGRFHLREEQFHVSDISLI